MSNAPIFSRRSLLLGGSALALTSTLLPHPLAAAAQQYTLGTATPGGGFQLFGATLAEAVASSGAGVSIDAVATKGSKQNIVLLREGKVDFGQVEGNAAHQAFEAQKDSTQKLMVAAAMYPGPGMFVVRADSPAKSIADLKGRKIAYGTRSSGLTILCKSVLTGLGYDPEKDFQPVYLEKSGHGVKKLLEGEVDAWWGGGFGWPGFVKVSESEQGARFLTPGAEGVEKIRAKFPYLHEMSVPAGSYKGIGSELQTVGMWSFILTRPDLPDADAKAFARAVHKAQPGLAAKIPQGKYTKPENTARYAPDGLLHPGAAAYLKEIGALN